MTEQPNYYAILPAFIRYDNDLPANARLLYGELTALANKKGYCFASNNYFAPLYGVTPQAVSKWIQALEKKGYITIEYIRENSAITERRIYLKDTAEVVARRNTDDATTDTPSSNESSHGTQNAGAHDTGAAKQQAPLPEAPAQDTQRDEDVPKTTSQTEGVLTTVDRYQRQVEGVSTYVDRGYQQKIKGNTTRVNITSLNDKAPALQLAQKLLALNRKLDDKFFCSTLQLEQWADCISTLHKRDKRDYEEIAAVIDFAKSDPFWQTIINSGADLQKNYTKLFLQMKNKKAPVPYTKNKLAPNFSDTALPDILKQSVITSVSTDEEAKFLDDLAF